MGWRGQNKLLKTILIRVQGKDPRIFENSIFPAYVPEKNKIITPWISFILLRLGCLIKNRPNNVLRQLKQIKNSVDLLPFLLF